jgi:hypothetical protein
MKTVKKNEYNFIYKKHKLMVYYFDENTVINDILAEYYTTNEGDYSIILEDYIDKFVSLNTVKMNKKIIKFYYNSSIKKIIKRYAIFMNTSIIHTKSDFFMNLTSIILYNNLYNIIETTINNDIISDNIDNIIDTAIDNEIMSNADTDIGSNSDIE